MIFLINSQSFLQSRLHILMLKCCVPFGESYCLPCSCFLYFCISFQEFVEAVFSDVFSLYASVAQCNDCFLGHIKRSMLGRARLVLNGDTCVGHLMSSVVIKARVMITIVMGSPPPFQGDQHVGSSHTDIISTHINNQKDLWGSQCEHKTLK